VNKKTKLSAILLGSALVGSAVLAGCGSGTSTTAVGSTKPGTNNPTGLYRELGSWPLPAQYQGNPFGAGGTGVDGFVYDGLFQFVRSTDKVYMHLAASEDDSVPGQTTIHLKKNVKWSDGQPFTSKDVWGYYMLNNGAELTHYLSSITTPDDYTVVFHWANPAPFDEMKRLFLAEDQMKIPYHYYKQWVDKAAALLKQAPADTDPKDQGNVPFGKKISTDLQKQLNDNWNDFAKHGPHFPIGLGPYTPDKMTATQFTLKQNPYYWGASNVKFKKVQLTSVQDLNQQYALLKAGKLDRYDGTQPKDILESILASNKDLVHYQMFDPACIGFIFNTAHKPFDNLTFRQAVIYALDRTKVREVGNYYGQTTDLSTTGMPTSEVNKYLTPDILAKFTKYPHDENKAAELLKSIGWTKNSAGIWQDASGKTYNFLVASDQTWVPAVNSGEVVAEQLTAFGLPTKYKAVDPGIYWGNVDTNKGAYDMSFDWVDVSWGFGFPWNPMTNFWWSNTARHAHEPQLNGQTAFTAKGYDGQDVNPTLLLHQIPFMTNEADRTKAIEEIAYVTNQSALAVNLFQNVTGTWMNMHTIGGVPWKDAIAKYNRDMPTPPADQVERIAETNEGMAGEQWMIDGTYYPN